MAKPAIDVEISEAGHPEPRPSRRVGGPSRSQVVALVVALCFLSGAVGWWIGRPSDPKFSDVDVGFLSDMETHHQGAISLAFAYLGRGQDPVVSQIAREVVLEQAQDISVMNEYLGQAGPSSTTTDDVAMDWMGLAVPLNRMPGMPTNAELAAVGASQGAQADEMFSRLMIDHHAAGVAMAEYAAEHGSNDDVRRLATAMAKVQRSEIAELDHRRSALGFTPVDAKTLEDLHAEHTG